MKKLMFGLVLLMAVLFFITALPAFAAEESDGIKKAGQQILGEKEAALLSIKAGIDALLVKMPEDNLITYREMKDLDNRIKDFNDARLAADYYLKFYSLSTATSLDKEVMAIRFIYFSHALFKTDSGQVVRTFFTKQTGRDIKVDWAARLGVGTGILLFFTLLFAFATVCCFVYARSDGDIIGGVIFALFTLFVLGVLLIA